MVEALAATSAQRPTLNRPEVMEKLKSTTWLGRVIALQGLLRPVSKMSLAMQKVDAVPWELMDEQREFHDRLVLMEAPLRDKRHRLTMEHSTPESLSSDYLPFPSRRAGF